VGGAAEVHRKFSGVSDGSREDSGVDSANDGDDAVPWYQGIEFFLSLRRLGKEAYLFNYNGEPHGLRRRPDQKDYTVRMQEFFDYLLKDAPKPAWMEKAFRTSKESRKKRSTTRCIRGRKEIVYGLKAAWIGAPVAPL